MSFIRSAGVETSASSCLWASRKTTTRKTGPKSRSN